MCDVATHHIGLSTDIPRSPTMCFHTFGLLPEVEEELLRWVAIIFRCTSFSCSWFVSFAVFWQKRRKQTRKTHDRLCNFGCWSLGHFRVVFVFCFLRFVWRSSSLRGDFGELRRSSKVMLENILKYSMYMFVTFFRSIRDPCRSHFGRC